MILACHSRAGCRTCPTCCITQGYHTGAFVGSLILDPLDGTAPGFDRGFEVYDAGFHLRRHGVDRYKTVERRADDVVNHALAWLSQVPNGPFFLWVHLYDAHDPYDPPAPFKARFASQPYDGEIAYADSAVGKLLAEIAQARPLRRNVDRGHGRPWRISRRARREHPRNFSLRRNAARSAAVQVARLPWGGQARRCTRPAWSTWRLPFFKKLDSRAQRDAGESLSQ